jgi:hypothetical protein
MSENGICAHCRGEFHPVEGIIWTPYIPLCHNCKWVDEGRHAILQIRKGGHRVYGGYDLYEWRETRNAAIHDHDERRWVHINCPQWFTTIKQVEKYATRSFKSHEFREGIQ